MSKPPPPELIEAMRWHCREDGVFSIAGLDDEWKDKVSYHDANGPPPGLEDTFDAYDVMRALEKDFEFTEDGWDCYLADALDVEEADGELASDRDTE